MAEEERQKAIKNIGLAFLCVNEYCGIGKCTKENCRFNHDIDEQQRADPSIQQMMEEKLNNLRLRPKDKRNLALDFCYFELKRKDGCRNGDQCRFNHEITEEHGNDQNLQDEVTAKYRKTHQNSPDIKRDEVKNSQAITVPLDFLQKMYMWMEKSTGVATGTTCF